MNRYSPFARAALLFLSLVSLLFLNACGELYALREIKTNQDQQIRDLANQLKAKSDESARLATQREVEIAALKKQLETARDETRRALNERSEREQRLAAENAQFQRQFEAQAFELNRYKKLEESWKGQQEQVDQDLRARIAELTAAKQEQERLQSSLAKIEENLQKEREKTRNLDQAMKSSEQKSKTTQTDLEKARQDLNTALARLAELQKENQTLQELASEQKDLLEAANSTSERAREIEKALEEARKRLEAQGKAGPALPATEDQDLKDAFALLRPTLKPLTENNFAFVVRTDRGVAVRLSADYLFQSGSVQLDENALPVLDEIAAVLKRYPRKYIEVQGHTDAQPLITMPFEDNWGLASERALKVVRYLVSQASVPPGRIKSASYSEYRPLPKDDEGASLRRRVEILLTPNP